MPFILENLEVYQKSVDFAEKVISPTEEFPKRTFAFSFFLLTGRVSKFK
jgi:hypothetical protein